MAACSSEGFLSVPHSTGPAVITPPRTPRSFGGTRCRDIMVARSSAAGGGSDSEMSGRAGVGRPGEGTAGVEDQSVISDAGRDSILAIARHLNFQRPIRQPRDPARKRVLPFSVHVFFLLVMHWICSADVRHRLVLSTIHRVRAAQ